MASSESLKVRAARPRSEGILAAETMVDLDQQIASPEYDYGSVWQDGLVNLPSNIAGLFSAQRQQIYRPESKSVVETPTGGFFEVTNPPVYGEVERGPGIESPAMRGLGYLSRLMAGDVATERQAAEAVSGGLAALPQGAMKMVRDLPSTAESMRQSAETGVPTVAYDYDEQGRPIEGTGAPPVLDPLLVMGAGAPQMAAAKLGKIPAGSLGIFGGRYAENLSPQMSDDYARATKMLDDGATSDQVYKTTGKIAVERTDIDPRELSGAPRSEKFVVRHHIPDNEMVLNDDVFKAFRMSVGSGDEFSLGSLISHPKLFEAYPSMRDVKVSIGTMPEMPGAAASWNEAKNLIRIRSDQVIPIEEIANYYDMGFNPQGVTKAVENTVRNILHEASHAVQGKETLSAYGPGGPSGRGTKSPMVLREPKAVGWLKGGDPSNEYRQLIKYRDKRFPKTFIDAQKKKKELETTIESDWSDFQLWSGGTLSLETERRFQRRRLKDKLEKLAGGRSKRDLPTKSTEAFFPRDTRNTGVMDDAEYANYAKQRTEFERTSPEFNDLQGKIREEVELQQIIDKSNYKYLQNRGETEARITELMRHVGPDDPINPQYQFNKVFEQMAESIENLKPYPSISVTKPEGMNKGGYVITGAETMMGLD